MSDGKKVSFGFSKTVKKSALQIPPKLEEKKVDYIECLDEKAIKVVGGKESNTEDLVIPMLGSKTWYDRIVNKTDADIFESKPKIQENGKSAQITNDSGIEPMDTCQIKKEVLDETENVPKLLEDQAASEIIEDLKSKDIKVEKTDLEVPVAEDESLRGKQESTLEDYEHIPIDGFGLAVLRGMGWKPGKGIGKNEKVTVSTVPELRPRGMGLGADKLIQQKQNSQPKTKEEEQLKIEKGSFVRVINGSRRNNYGQIEGFDDGAGRLIVKLAMTGETLSLNENVVEPVTQSDFAKNSRVLNATKFEKYKNRTDSNGKESATIATSDSETSNDQKSKNRRAERSTSPRRRKKLKRCSKYSYDDDSDSYHISKQQKSSSESDYEYRQKKLKKSKKSHRRDSSSDRSSKKNKKKDKEREKTRGRRAEYSESSDRRHKKHKRSRSRSPRRR